MTLGIARWFTGLFIAAVAMGLVLTGAAHARTVAGDWHGTLTVQGIALRLVARIKPVDGGGFAGELMSPDQSDKAVGMADVKQEGQALTFAVPAIRAEFKGAWDAGKRAWVGTFTQLGSTLPMTFEPGDLPKGPVLSGLDGDWEGTIGSQELRIRLVLHVRQGAYGTIASLDSPDQLAMGLPLAGLSQSGAEVVFEQALTGSRYKGTLSADGQSLVGGWTQRGATKPVTFVRRATQAAAPRRPQTPKPPFPYQALDVAFDSAPGVRLAGTLTLPPGKGPFPAAVLITGSGAQDRDESLLGHKPFAVLADALTRKGIAVLRYDDRGFGKSTGDFLKATTTDFAADAAAGVAFLRSRRDIAPRKVGLIGHSEGGIVAPMVAAKDPRLGFVVLMAGPGVALRDVMTAQRAAIGPTAGASAELIRRGESLNAHVLAAMAGAKDQSEAEGRARAVLVAETKDLQLTPAAIDVQARQLSSDWFRRLMDYDPAPALSQVKAPILAVNGSKDLQVPAAQSLPAIRAATRANPDVTIVELASLNHLFQTAKTGAPGEYADIEETLAPVALDTITNWVVARTRR